MSKNSTVNAISTELLSKFLNIFKERDIIELTLTENGIKLKTYRKNNNKK